MSDKKHQVDKIAQEAAVNLAGWKKALADYQNLQKDMVKQIASLKDASLSNVVLEILPIFDNYQTAIQHIPPGQKTASWAVGLEHILKMWQSFLTDNQIEQILTLGQRFDPHIHEAVDKAHDKTQADQIIIKELQAGFMHKDRIIRPAKVVVNNL